MFVTMRRVAIRKRLSENFSDSILRIGQLRCQAGLAQRESPGAVISLRAN